MGIRAISRVGAGLAAIVLACLNPGRAQQPLPAPFAPGETLTYEISWSVFRAGQVVVTLSEFGKGSGDLYEVTTTARSQGFVSLLYNVQDEFRSVFDPETLCSRWISKGINEGRRHKETRLMFDTARRLAILDERDLTKANNPTKHAENEIPSCVQDVVTAFYFVRRQPLRVGQQIRVPINDGSKTYEVAAEVQARERIQTPYGTREAFRVEPKVFGGLYKRKGRMLIWFSDDAQRVPLRIKAMIAVGSITGDLKSVAYPSPSTAPQKP